VVLLCQSRPGLLADDVSSILDAFSKARAHALKTMTLKLVHWTTQPWLSCALAHWDGDLARRIATQIMDEFDRTGFTLLLIKQTSGQQLSGLTMLGRWVLSFGCEVLMSSTFVIDPWGPMSVYAW
jgi:hypothetical protein